MAIYDDDDSYEARRGAESWDIDEDPDGRDIVPDDRTTTQCAHCRKHYFEDSPKCPFCKHWRMDDERQNETGAYPKPLWWYLTVVACIAGLVFGSLGVLRLFSIWPWG